jgi:CRP/FNR family transcriptional regulator, cyclic AMP receptor protein
MTDATPTSSAPTIAQRLRQIPLFTQLDDTELERIGRAARDKSYPKGSVILFEDDPGDALYVVLSGQVKVVLIGEDGREVILSMLKIGDFFGEMSLIDDQPRSAHVIAVEDSGLLVLRRDDFRACLEESPRIALGLLQALSRRLRRADDKIGGLVLLDVNGRVARLLLELADEHDGQTIPRKVTHHTIAQMIGSSRETVSRTIRDLGDQGLIRVSRKDIAILERATLEDLAGL